MGLLDSIFGSSSSSGQMTPQQMGLLNAGLGMMAGATGRPGQGRPTFGQAAFAGLNGYNSGMQNAYDMQAQQLKQKLYQQQVEQEQAKRNAIFSMMQNLPEDQRPIASVDPKAYADAKLKAQYSPGTSDMQDYRLAQSQGYKGNFMKFKRDNALASRAPTAPDAATVKYNLLIANGTPPAEAAKIVAGGSGAGRGFYAIPTSSGYIKMDKTTGETSPITAQDMKSGNIEPITGGTPTPTQQAPMMLPPSADVNLAAAKASATQQGNVQGQAAANMPSTIQSKDYVLGIIDSIINDPQLPNALGMIDSRLPDVTGYNTEIRSKIDQLKGNSFLQAYQGLKGGGQITEVEGKKATEAQMRINEAQTPAEFKSALRDAADLIKQRFTVQKQQAGASVVQPGQGMSSDDALINKYLK